MFVEQAHLEVRLELPNEGHPFRFVLISGVARLGGTGLEDYICVILCYSKNMRDTPI